MKFKKQITSTLILAMSMSLFSACSTTENMNSGQDKIYNSNSIQSEQVVEIQETMPLTPITPLETTETGETSPMENTGKYYKLTKLFDNLTVEGENIIFSPLSLNFALGMASNTVADEFADEFEKYFGMTINEYNEFCKQYIDAKRSGVEIANSIWLKDEYTLNKNTEQAMSENYNAEISTREFNDAFVSEVNQWCAEKTHDKIQKILEETPGDDMVAYLINALYFKENWMVPYEEYQLQDTQFKTFDGEINVTGMRESSDMRYLENDYATGFMKPYENGYAFVGILPKEEGDFNLSELDIDSLMENQARQEVITMIPKFTFETSMKDLINDMKTIGLDLEAMIVDKLANEDERLAFSNVIQKAMIDVDEKGTTAAAITSIGVKTTALINEEPPKEVILDRPFAFMIYDVENDVVLFMGKVTNPSATN